jgi:hypothetical protein
LEGIAVNVSEEPAQPGFDPEVIEIFTEGLRVLFTVIIIELELTVAVLAQASEEVSSQLITSPLLRDPDE